MIIGLSIAAPVGPIGVLCIRRTLAGGFRLGFVSGLGAASADAVYGSIAAFGLTALSEVLVRHHAALRLVGGGFLILLGIRAFFARPAAEAAAGSYGSLAGALASTFLLTLTNPMTILAFTGIFAGLGIASSGVDFVAAGVTVAGVYLGSAAWWVILSGVVSRLRASVLPEHLRWVNRVSGVVIAGFGAAALYAGIAG